MKAVNSGGSKKIVRYSKYSDFTPLKDHPNSLKLKWYNIKYYLM